MQSIRTAFTFNSDGNSVVAEVRNILCESELPEDWKSEPWNIFLKEMMTYEMDTRQMKSNCVNIWQAYARRWRELEPDSNRSLVQPVFAGSYAEGMPNACDLDLIFVGTWAETYEYFGKLQDNVNSLPFISELCHPGYIKIIVPSNSRRYYGFQDYLIEKDGRHYFLSSKGYVRSMKEWHKWGTTGYDNHINGPALTEDGVEGTSTDIVHAFKCAHWPSFANDIFQRANFNGDVEKMKHLGVYAVATGHALSKHKDIEWRLSFTEAEKVMVMNWTDTQYHCYYLLKHLKMIHLKSSDVLCSYFMKTVIFWVSDVIHNAKWQPIRLMELLFKSLTLLHIMYRNHYLPNYFIPQNNMIDHKSKDGCLILADMISTILTSGRIKETIAELLCENVIEDIFIYSMNWYTKHQRITSCRILCKAIRKCKEMSKTFSEQLIMNESLILSSLSIMMPIQSRSQCEVLEEVVAILPQIISLEFIDAFRTVIRRQIADYYHSLRTRYSRKKAESLYKDSLSLIYPCGFNDRLISGRVQLALFYYLDGDFTIALTEMNKIRPVIVNAIKNWKVDQYLQISFPVCLKERFTHDKFLFELVSTSLMNHPFVMNVTIIGVYGMIQCTVRILSHDGQDDVLGLYFLLKDCEDQLYTPKISDDYQCIANGIMNIIKEKYNISYLPQPVQNILIPTRMQAVKQYWDNRLK